MDIVNNVISGVKNISLQKQITGELHSMKSITLYLDCV